MRSISVAREYDAREHICLDAFDNPKKGVIALVFPLTAYFDASENRLSPTRPNSPLLHTVGCYLATVEDWRKFQKEWRLELGKKNVPYFHMKDFEYALSAIKRGERDKVSSKSFYKNWGEDEFVPFQNRLYRTINRKRKDGSYRLVGFVSSVVKEDFDKTLPDELKGDPECQSYYIFNVANLMKAIAFWCSQNVIYDPIHYIFAGGDNEGGNIERWVDYLWNKDEQSKNFFRLNKGYSRAGYDIQWMQDVSPLQAADIVAYEFNKVAVEVTGRGYVAEIPLEELRKSLPNLCKTAHFGLALGREYLLDAFAQIIRLRKSKGLL